MKVVCCKNCGAKYQIDDKDFAFYYECSSCAGDLVVLESYPDKYNSHGFDFLTSTKTKNAVLVRCEECGLKYIIKKSDSILDYECSGCGGSLRYLNPEMDMRLKNYIRSKRKELSLLKKQQPKVSLEKKIYDDSYIIKSLKDRFFTYFSVEQIYDSINEEKKEEEASKLKSQKTARTSIPEYALMKYGKEFRLPRSDNYDVLKDFLKKEFFKGMNPYYTTYEEPKRLIDQFKYEIFHKNENGILSQNIDDDFFINIDDLKLNHYIVIFGIILIILAVLVILYVNSLFGLLFLFISVATFFYGLYMKDDEPQNFYKTKIIRQYLLLLPEEYYIFYNVEIPNSPVGINHVIVGPTGLYTIISEKFNTDKTFSTESNLIKLINEDNSENMQFKYGNDLKFFRYTLSHFKYSRNNEIKYKSLILSENLIDFFNENNIEICFVEPLVAFVNNEIVVVNMPLTDEDLFIEELMHIIQTNPVKLNQDMIDKCAVLLSKYSADCTFEIL